MQGHETDSIREWCDACVSLRHKLADVRDLERFVRFYNRTFAQLHGILKKFDDAPTLSTEDVRTITSAGAILANDAITWATSVEAGGLLQCASGAPVLTKQWFEHYAPVHGARIAKDLAKLLGTWLVVAR